MHPPQRVVARAVGTADLSGAAQHVGEFAGIFFSQHSFFGAHTKDDLLRIAE